MNIETLPAEKSAYIRDIIAFTEKQIMCATGVEVELGVKNYELTDTITPNIIWGIVSKHAEGVMARKLYCILARNHTKNTLQSIGEVIDISASGVNVNMESGYGYIKRRDKNYMKAYNACENAIYDYGNVKNKS